MIRGISRSAVPGLLALTLGSTAPAFAALQHEGDVQPFLTGGQVQLNANLFGADFGDLPGGLFRTDDPGYDANTALGAFGPGNWLQFNGVGSLKYWDGSSWLAGTPNGEHIVITDALGNESVFSASGISNAFGVIGQFDGLGDLHEHLDISLRDATETLGGAVGAYWIALSLWETAPNSTNPVSAPSKVFNLVFNRGLSGADFETAVGTVSAVPLPAAVYLLGSAMAALLVVGRRDSEGAVA